MTDCIFQKNVLSKKECDIVIDFFNKRTEFHNPGEAGGSRNEKSKKSVDINMVFSPTKEDELKYSIDGDIRKVNDILKKGIIDALHDYKKKYFFIDYECLNPWILNEYYNIQRYLPNEGYFSLHCENAGKMHSPSELVDCKRMLVWMLYLNDVTDGGYTEFPHQDKKFQPICGDMILWPAFWTHPHKGVTSKTQTKYIATGWFSFNTEISFFSSADGQPTRCFNKPINEPDPVGKKFLPKRWWKIR